MSQSPIHKALSILRKHRVRALLMGGQACILYGAAEFSRDVDLAVLADERGLGRVHLLSLADLVQAKKTQRDRDWPMIRRLVEADYYRRSARPTRAHIVFWLREVRTAEILVALCRRYTGAARRLTAVRPAVRHALRGDRTGVEHALQAEQEQARALDRQYWAPLRAELARWRRRR